MADAVFTLTESGRRNLGGGMLIVGGDIATDTGDYMTGGITPNVADVVTGGVGALAKLDTLSNRKPWFVYFNCPDDGFIVHYNWDTEKIQIFSITATGAPGSDVNQPFTEYGNLTALAAMSFGYIAFWLPEWDNS